MNYDAETGFPDCFNADFVLKCKRRNFVNQFNYRMIVLINFVNYIATWRCYPDNQLKQLA